MKETFVAWQTQKTSPHRLHSEVPLAKNKQSSERIWSGKVFFFFLLEELKYSRAKKDLTAEFVCMELVLDVCIMLWLHCCVEEGDRSASFQDCL